MMTKTLRVLALGALAVGCHLDKLLGGSGGGSPPPSHGTPVGLAFTNPPRSVQAGRPIGPVQVSIVDSAGNPVAGVDTVTVVVTLHDNPGSDTLNGTKNTHPVNGVATFTNLSLNTPGQGYTLEASAGPLNKLSDPFNIMPPPPTTGALTVTTNTPANPPAAGYTVTVNGTGGTTKGIGASGTVTFVGLSAGNHSVTLGDVPSNCTVSGGDTQPASVTANQTTPVTFTITCAATTGSIAVTTTTGGSNLPSGYTVTVDGRTQSVAASGTVTFDGLNVGNHSVGLSPIPSNCSVSGANPQTVAVTAGNTTPATFSISCTAPPPDHPPVVNAGGNQTIMFGSVTVNWSLTDPDNDAPWTYSIDWD